MLRSLKHRRVLVAAALAAAAASLWVFSHDARRTSGAAGSAAGEQSGGWFRPGLGSAGAGAVQPERFRTGLEHLPSSLKGTEVPGKLELDAAGRLKISRSLRDLFDYFLSTAGEESDARIRARIEAYAHDHLPGDAANQLMALYDQYFDFKQRASKLAADLSGDGLPQISRRLESLRLLRNEVFSADVAQAFFAADDVYDNYQLAKAAMLQDATLSATEKAARLAQLRNNLPDDLRDGISVTETVQTLNAITEQWKQHAGTPAELQAIRQQLVGPEATARLEALDVQVAQWNSRVDGYLNQRDKILADPSLSDPARQQQLQSLRDQNFSSSEQVRVAALERIHDAPPTPAGTP